MNKVQNLKFKVQSEKTVTFIAFSITVLFSVIFLAVWQNSLAQTSYLPNSITITPLSSNGGAPASGAASWRKGQQGFVSIGSLPTSTNTSNSIIQLYLANPTTFATTSLILETAPQSAGTGIYAIDASTLSATTNGNYGLVAVYTVYDPSFAQYIATSSAAIHVLPVLSPSAGNANQDTQCMPGFYFDPFFGFCIVIPTGGIVTTCPPGYGISPTTGVCAPSSGSNGSTVPLNSSSNNTGSTVGSGSAVNTGNQTSANTPYGGLVVCTGVSDGTNRPVCNFNYLIIEGQHIINFLFMIAIPVAAVLFAYGGILYMVGNEGSRKKANGIFWAAGIGFGIMLIAWVSVYTVVNWLTNGVTSGTTSSQSGITTFLGK
ncbi:MAG: hypothetical protein KGJ35_02645 [Patescibacteria group bacterium]|nr:hypothetical protein [Patescibacteria group bacterium]